MKDLFGHLRRRERWILAAWATVVVVCAMAIGLNGARSSNPIPADKQTFQDREAASHEAAVALASEHAVLLPSRNPVLVLPTVQPTSWSIGIVPKVVPPFSGALYTVKSSWVWDLDGNHVLV